MSLLLALQGPASTTLNSVQALPLGGTVTIADPIAAASTKALPFGGSVVLGNRVTLTESRTLPLAGTNAVVVLVAVDANITLPLGGTVEFSTGGVVPVVEPPGTGGPRRFVLDRQHETPKHTLPRRRIGSRQRLALRGHIDLVAAVAARSDASLGLRGTVELDSGLEDFLFEEELVVAIGELWES